MNGWKDKYTKYKLTMKNGREFELIWSNSNVEIWLLQMKGSTIRITEDIRIDASYIGIIEVLEKNIEKED